MRMDKLGDRMPDRRAAKWSEMRPNPSRMSEDWVPMWPSDAKMSERWVEQNNSSAKMSEKWIPMNATESQFSNKWQNMKQTERQDPYQMYPNDGDRKQGFKSQTKVQPDGGIVRRSTQRNEFGSSREI